MICGLKWPTRMAPNGEIVISAIAQRTAATSLEAVSADLIHAAFSHSSVGIALCDADFAVRVRNPAIERLIALVPGNGTGALHGLTLIGLLGVEVPPQAEIVSRGGWRGVGDLGLGRKIAGGEVYVTVEAFRGENQASGWLITAREQTAQPALAVVTERQLIARSEKLTPREREVMLALQEGAGNKAIALRLGISPRTVEFHRARILQRFAATSIVDLVRKVTSDVKASMGLVVPSHQ